MHVPQEEVFTFGPADYAQILAAQFGVALTLVGANAPRLTAPPSRPDRHVPIPEDRHPHPPSSPLTARL